MEARATKRLLAFAAGTALFLMGCHRDDSVFTEAGPASRSIGRLGAVVVAGLGIVALVMLVIIVAAAARRRGTLEEHEPAQTGGGQRWIWIGGFAIPAVVLGSMLIATLRVSSEFPLHDGEHYRSDIHLIGRQWWWEVQYVGDTPSQRVVTANEIHVPIDWPIEIELESRDVIHSFWVPALHGKVDLVPGHPNHIRIQATTPGRYEGQCAEYCGSQHTLMKFAVVAEPLEDFERWLAHESQPAAPPPDPEAAKGLTLFETRACGVCHTVRGTRAAGTVGPDLTHLAGRKGIAANSYPNSTAYLEAWITHAQSLKPGSQMPDLTSFSGEELQALTHYLQSLQ